MHVHSAVLLDIFFSMLSFSFCLSPLFACLEGSQFMCLSFLSLVFCGADECSAAINSISGVPQPRIHLSERHLRELILNQNSHTVMQLGEANSLCVCVCVVAPHCMNDLVEEGTGIFSILLLPFFRGYVILE